jgi:hypothetical protein
VQQGLLFYTLDQKTTAEREAQAKDKRLNLYLMGQRRLFSFLERACCSCCYCSYCFPPKYILHTHTHPFFGNCLYASRHTLGRSKKCKRVFLLFFSIVRKGENPFGIETRNFCRKHVARLSAGLLFILYFFSRGCCRVFLFLNESNSTRVGPIKWRHPPAHTQSP